MMRLCRKCKTNQFVLKLIQTYEGWFWKYSLAHSFTESLQISISKLNLSDSSRNSVIRFQSVNGTKHYFIIMKYNFIFKISRKVRSVQIVCLLKLERKQATLANLATSVGNIQEHLTMSIIRTEIWQSVFKKF